MGISGLRPATGREPAPTLNSKNTSDYAVRVVQKVGGFQLTAVGT